jgi:hypothetical protein
MYPSVVTKDPAAVEREVQQVYSALFPDGDREFVVRAFNWVTRCFAGDYAGFRPIDARYHDLEHTLQGTLCMARLLRGREAAGGEPRLTQRLCELGILAILLHDTGYLKTRDDDEGTGAKYTVQHVDRSASFAARLMADEGFSPGEIRSVQNMIHCTGVNAKVSGLPFQTDLERAVGCALGAADLLGQMAAADYVEKLPALYEEFAEAARFSGDKAQFIASFTSPEDLVRRTPLFWENFVKPKLTNDYEEVSRFLSDPYPSGPNEYIDRIEANMERLKRESNLK